MFPSAQCHLFLPPFSLPELLHRRGVGVPWLKDLGEQQDHGGDALRPARLKAPGPGHAAHTMERHLQFPSCVPLTEEVAEHIFSWLVKMHF